VMTGTGILKAAQTDERGSYLFNDLQPGIYKVTVSAKAFSSRVVAFAISSQDAKVA